VENLKKTALKENKEMVMHPIYLPFSEEMLKRHFADVKEAGVCKGTADRHIDYYRKSIRNYEEYLANNRDRKGKPLSEMRGPSVKAALKFLSFYELNP
jgi:2-phosphoglycerate kinase